MGDRSWWWASCCPNESQVRLLITFALFFEITSKFHFCWLWCALFKYYIIVFVGLKFKMSRKICKLPTVNCCATSNGFCNKSFGGKAGFKTTIKPFLSVEIQGKLMQIISRFGFGNNSLESYERSWWKPDNTMCRGQRRWLSDNWRQ